MYEKYYQKKVKEFGFVLFGFMAYQPFWIIQYNILYIYIYIYICFLLEKTKDRLL